MAVNASILKAVVSFFRIDVNTLPAPKKKPISFLGLKELSSKYGLGDFDLGKNFYAAIHKWL